jgi:uncharacterized protein (TIGR02453 family)
MLHSNVLPFLKELNDNNNREWFNENKKWFQQANNDFHIFIDQLIEQIVTFDPTVAGISAKDCVFRIYRDVRFSKDKSPYKTHFGALIGQGGRKSKKAGYYAHVELNGNSIAGGGIYGPDKDVLKAIRNELLVAPEDMLEIIEAPDFKQYFKGLWGDKLKLAPKGYPKDFEYIELLKYKSFVVLSEIPDKELDGEQLVWKYADIYKAMYPFNRLLNHIYEEME